MVVVFSGFGIEAPISAWMTGAFHLLAGGSAEMPPWCEMLKESGRTILVSLIAVPLVTGLLLFAVARSKSWSSADGKLQVEPPAKVRGPLGRDLRVVLHGSGLDAGAEVWMAPEVVQRQAVVGSINTYGSPQQVVRQGDLLYVANLTRGILLVDGSDPGRPRVVGSLDTLGQVLETVLKGEMLYLAAGEGGLQVVSVADPTAPKLLTAVRTLSAVMAVAGAGNRLCVATSSQGLQYVDITVPEHPRVVGALMFPGPVRDVEMGEGFALVALGMNGGAVVDLANPKMLRQVARLPLPPRSKVICVALQGNRAFVGTAGGKDDIGGGLWIFDLKVPARPRLEGGVLLSGQPSRIRVVGDRVAVALGGGGVEIFSGTDPSRLQRLHLLDALKSARGVELDGDTVWISDGGLPGRLLAMDLSRHVPLPMSRCRTEAPLDEMPLASDRWLYVPLKRKGIGILDISVPDAVVQRSLLPVEGWIKTLLARDGLLFVFRISLEGPMRSELLIADLRDPDRPHVLSSLPLPATFSSLALGNGFLVAGGAPPDLTRGESSSDDPGRKELKILDISDLRRPRVVAEIGVRGSVLGMTVADGLLYLVHSEGEFQTYDLHDPQHPRLLAAVSLPWLHQTVARPRQSILLHKGVAMVVGGVGGVTVIDVADPRHPVRLGTMDVGGFADSEQLVGDLLYVGTEKRGMLAIDVEEPLAPRIVSWLDQVGMGKYWTVAGDRLWFAPRDLYGLRAIPLPRRVEAEVRQGDSELTLRIDSPELPGNYSLWVVGRRQRQELPGCVEFGGG